MKQWLAGLLLVSAGIASAGELDDAYKFLQAKEYAKAFPLFTKLANAGNAEAQFRLGEMYWYGDATQPDLGKAAELFQKAAAAGNADARESLALLKRRETRGADITYWTTGYTGTDLVSGKFACKAPDLPVLSKTNDEINKNSKAIADWQACYNGFVANFNANMPPLKHIPADVAEMMTPAEIEKARTHLEGVYGKVIASAQADAAAATARQDAWRTSTQKYVAEQNVINAKASEAQSRVLQEQQRKLNEGMVRPITATR